MFSGRQQQDVHELLHCTLSYIQDSINRLNAHRNALKELITPQTSKTCTETADQLCSPSSETTNSCAKSGAANPKNSNCRRSKDSTEVELKANVASSVAQITSFFARAAAKPKSLADVKFNTKELLDFVEESFGGFAERRTRCLECEHVTRCSESFQDVEVVVKKNFSRHDSDESDEEVENNGKQSFLFKARFEGWGGSAHPCRG